jgi:hypothetical protein
MTIREVIAAIEQIEEIIKGHTDGVLNPQGIAIIEELIGKITGYSSQSNFLKKIESIKNFSKILLGTEENEKNADMLRHARLYILGDCAYIKHFISEIT